MERHLILCFNQRRRTLFSGNVMRRFSSSNAVVTPHTHTHRSSRKKSHDALNTQRKLRLFRRNDFLKFQLSDLLWVVWTMESLSEAASGAIGAVVSTTVHYPLDTCKTKYQVEVRSHNQKYRSISDVLWEAVSTGQIMSLYQGLGAKNVQAFISQFIYFYGYSFFKRLYLEKTGAKTIGTKANLLIAAAAGACNVVVIQPLDVASSKMQTSEFGKSKGLLKTLAEEKWSSVFDGLGISLLLTSNPAIQYTVFDQLKRRMLENQTSNQTEALSALSAFVIGAASKCIATFLTYPAIRCKVMIQSAEDHCVKSPEGKSEKTVSSTLHDIWKREGMPGFFKGLNAQILKTVLSSALHLMIKEKITKTTWVLMLALQRYLLVSRVRLKTS